MENNKFLHTINLYTDWVCNNIAIPSPINSVLAMNLFGLKEPVGTPLYNCNVEDLYEHPERCFGGFGSPSFRTLQFASIFRKGLMPINGLGKVMAFTDEQKQQNIIKADLEIDFERERQAHFADKPSRLTSLFIVEDTDDGRLTLQNVFADSTKAGWFSPHILNVKVILSLRSHKGDIRWLDQYLATKDRNCITQYWEGNIFDKNKREEILLEGTLLPTSREQLEFVRMHGTFFQDYDYRRHWQDLNSKQYDQWFT